MAAITMTIKDDTDTIHYGLLEVPLTQTLVDGTTNINDLNGSPFTYVLYSGRRKITHKWTILSAEEYQALRSMERRQYTAFKRPKLTIERLGVVDMPVMMTIGNQEIVNNCGAVRDVEVEFTETVPESIGGDSANS